MTTRGETYQGNPCHRGHSGIRYRKGGGCIDCQKLSDTARRQRLKEQPAAPATEKPA